MYLFTNFSCSCKKSYKRTTPRGKPFEFCLRKILHTFSPLESLFVRPRHPYREPPKLALARFGEPLIAKSRRDSAPLHSARLRRSISLRFTQNDTAGRSRTAKRRFAESESRAKLRHILLTSPQGRWQPPASL